MELKFDHFHLLYCISRLPDSVPQYPILQIAANHLHDCGFSGYQRMADGVADDLEDLMENLEELEFDSSGIRCSRKKKLETITYGIDGRNIVEFPSFHETLRILSIDTALFCSLEGFERCISLSDWLISKNESPSKILLDIGEYYTNGDFLIQKIIDVFSNPIPNSIAPRYREKWEKEREKLIALAKEMSQ